MQGQAASGKAKEATWDLHAHGGRSHLSHEGAETTSQLIQEVAAVVRKHPLKEVPSPGRTRLKHQYAHFLPEGLGLTKPKGR